MVDEYQDTNEAQSVLVALLAGAGGNVCCVGDDDQLMYVRAAPSRGTCSRSASGSPRHARIVLGRNFRSRAEILEPAARCIAHNQQASSRRR